MKPLNQISEEDYESAEYKIQRLIDIISDIQEFQNTEAQKYLDKITEDLFKFRGYYFER